MGARQRMKHRLYLQRNQASANAYGHKSPPDWQALATVAGYVWAPSEQVQHSNELSQSRGEYRAIIPDGTDVTEADRVEKVEDRADTPKELFGTMVIDGVMQRPDHIALRLRSHV